MQPLDWDESLVLAEFAERECKHLDLIASWEVLNSVYEVLGFVGPLTDDQRLDEYKSVITSTNKFLTKMRKGLVSSRTIEDAIEYLGGHMNTANMDDVRTRPSVAYNKLKQRWIASAVIVLQQAAERIALAEGERDAD